MWATATTVIRQNNAQLPFAFFVRAASEATSHVRNGNFSAFRLQSDAFAACTWTRATRAGSDDIEKSTRHARIRRYIVSSGRVRMHRNKNKTQKKNIEIERNNLLFARKRISDGITNNQVICANGCRNAVAHQQHMCRMLSARFFRRRLCNFKRNNKLFGRSAVANAIKWNFTQLGVVAVVVVFIAAAVARIRWQTDRHYMWRKKCKCVVVFVEWFANNGGPHSPRAQPHTTEHCTGHSLISRVNMQFLWFVSYFMCLSRTMAAPHKCFMMRIFSPLFLASPTACTHACSTHYQLLNSFALGNI